jgi:NitT/TauT family transport system permease protein
MSSAVLSPARIPAWLMRTLVIVFLLGIWEAGSQFGYINAFTAPPPSAVFAAFIRLVQAGDISRALALTFFEAFAAAAIGSVVGISIGYWLHRVKKAGLAYTSWVAAAASAPLVLIYPLFLVIFGRNAATIIAMGAMGCMPPIILKAKEGLDGVRPVLLNVGRSFSLNARQQFWMIQFPAALPTIFNGIRIGLLFAIINVVGVEFLIAMGGLGYMIAYLGDRFDYPGMYAGILFVIFVSVIFFWLTERLEKWLLSSR